MAQKWGPFDSGPLSIEERFTSQGRARQDEIWQIYVTSEGMSAPLFDKTGRKVFQRHELNNRNEVSHRRSLKETLKQFGFARGVRGNPWVIAKKISDASSGDASWAESRELLMMTSATLIEALYEAVDDYLAERAKSSIKDLNEKEKAEFYETQIGRSVREGITNVTVFHERTPTDVLDWLKDFGNQFNKQASKASCIEHLLALDKIEPALNLYLETFTPPMTSSHKEFERTCKSYVDSKFPGRFSSYRELQSATAFRNRLVEYKLWDHFISYCNQHMDFHEAGEMDSGNIYRICNAVSRKFLALAPRPCQVQQARDPDVHEYGWADLCMAVLKFAIPHAATECPTEMTIPLSLAKLSDVDKIETFFTPMNHSKAAKLPETLKEAREKAAAKQAATKKKNKKADAKKPAKPLPSKRREADDAGLDAEQFSTEMTDALGNVRLTLFADDILNAINYTLDKVQLKHHKKNHVSKALDLAVLFALDGSLKDAGMPKLTAWTRVRQHIKTSLNRAHALQARMSDPDKPLSQLDPAKTRENEFDDEDEEQGDNVDPQASLKMLSEALKFLNEKAFSAFMEGNFGDLQGQGDSDGEAEAAAAPGQTVPTLASVIDCHPGIRLVMNKVKKASRAFVTGLKQPRAENGLLQDLILEVVKATNSVFDPAFMAVTVFMVACCQQRGCDLGSFLATSASVPLLVPHRKTMKVVVQALGASKSNAMNFMAHRTVYVLGGIQALQDELANIVAKHQDNPLKALKLNGVADSVSAIISKIKAALMVLRNLVEQISAMDVDFVESWSDQQGHADALTQFATMWQKMVVKVSGVSGSSMRRTEADWQYLQAGEIKKIMKVKTVKSLAGALAVEFPKHKDALPPDFPKEITDCWVALAGGETNTESGKQSSFESALGSLKKEILATGMAIFEVDAQRNAEETNCQEFERRVTEALEHIQKDEDQDAPASTLDAVAEPVLDKDFLSLPAMVPDNKHWAAHHAASLATVVLVDAFAGKRPLADVRVDVSGGSGLMFDKGVEDLRVIKKKLSLRVEAGTEDASSALSSKLEALRLSFVGRLVVVPCGQPASVAKSKLKLASNFFQNLGFDLYVVPVTKQESADFAIRSPLLVPAWLVRATAKQPCMDFQTEDIVIHAAFQNGEKVAIDISYPFLIFKTSLDQATKIKTVDRDGAEHQWLGFELTRPLSQEEAGEAEQRALHKAAKDAKQKLKKQRESAYEDDGFEDPVHYDTDNQIQLPSAFLKHILR